MKKKPFVLAASLLALGALLNTAAFAITEQEWFDRPVESVMVLVTGEGEVRR